MTETQTHDITLTVNGVKRRLRVESRTLLMDALRTELGLPGTHDGCSHGVCGACTVRINGETARACLTFAVQVDGDRIDTVEGLAIGGELHPIQEAFWRRHGLQCGFCTPGMLMVASEFLEQNPEPTREEAREAMASNLCRCTGYQHIVDSVMEAAARLRGEEWSEEAGIPANELREKR
jgi:aerobic-type carbon monoxide dehydrogenase small subunit (CoxS/CutS family)